MSLSWKDKPCHFTWNLQNRHSVHTSVKKIIRDIDNNVQETKFLQLGNLLFRACLEVWFHRNVDNGRKLLDEADNYIENQTDTLLKKGYKSVALLNRIWIEHRSQNTQKVHSLITELDALQLEEKDERVVDAVKATALMRLGPNTIDITLQLFEAAYQQFPTNPDFLFGVAITTGRKMRRTAPSRPRYDDLDKVGQDLMDNEKAYWEKILEVNPDYHLARSHLGINLSRRGHGENDDALKLLKEAYENAPNVHEVCRNLNRYYKANKRVDDAVTILKHAIDINPNRGENHFQLALCYIMYTKRRGPNKIIWNEKALEELNKCLELDDSHIFALMAKAKQLSDLKRNDEAERLYENTTLQSENLTDDRNLKLYFNFASFLRKNKSALRYQSQIGMWQKVMELATVTSCEYRDEKSGEWKVHLQGKYYKKQAYDTLLKHYQLQENSDLQLGILYYQNFEFSKAKDTLRQLDPTTNLEIPLYIAKTYIKWGREKEVGNQVKHYQLEEASEFFTKARENIILSRELGLEPKQARKLLADTALYIAHNQLQVKRALHESQCSTSLDQGANQVQSKQLTSEETCITSYREAVKCGSLAASLELLRLIQTDYIQITSRSKFIQILAEIKVCCSRTATDFQHTELKPLSFEKGPYSLDTDIDSSALFCKTIKRDISSILRGKEYFRQAWTQHFKMEVHILKERFRNSDGELELDGREEDLMEKVSVEIENDAADCCEKLRPLLDRVVVTFEQQELNITEEKNHYFPLIIDNKLAKERLKETLIKKLSYFGIDMEKHYPKLFQYLLKIQPAYNSQNDFLVKFFTVVNKIKHSLGKILDIVEDPVTLARQCTDKVEEICNVFFDTMEKSKCLKEEVNKLVADIRGGMHEKADPDRLFKILLYHEDFVVRMGSTWEFLEMLALIRCSKEQSGSASDPETESKLLERNSKFSTELRKRHLAVEVTFLRTKDPFSKTKDPFSRTKDPSSKDVLEKCKNACKEVNKVLKMALMKKEDSQNVSQRETDFPFYDLHPGDAAIENNGAGHWKGKVNDQLLKKDLKPLGISRNDKRLHIILKAQPCTNEDNYQFIAMRQFLEKSDDDIIQSTGMVSMATDNNVTKEYRVLDLTRWCTDHAETIVSEIIENVNA